MRKHKWLRLIVVLAVALLAASTGLSRALQSSRARRYLIAHLETSFGRTVEVGRFDFSLLNGARLEANSVTVSEDPRFGNEYFLRAESLTAGLRWSAIFSGRFEFGAVSLVRPSLNLVRDSRGQWNIASWLPRLPAASDRPGFMGPPQAPRGPLQARLSVIDVNGGRINFKQGDDKSGFALLDVSGRVEQDAPGRWRLDIEAQPMRAGAELQEIGTLRVRGDIGGTSARLRPADLAVTWSDVSLADALRFSRQFDYGMRGTLAVDLNARVAPPDPADGTEGPSGGALWTISGVARLQGVHGWKFPPRNSDPSANLALDAEWHLGEPHATIDKLLIEMANSHVQGSGSLDWEHGFLPELHVESSSIGLADVLSWYRALVPGVPADVNLQGALGVDATIAGWPPQLEQGALASVGGKLTESSLPGELRIGAINASVSRGGLDFAPTEISFSPPAPATSVRANVADALPANAFTISGAIFPDASTHSQWPPNWSFSINGGTSRMQDWLVVAQMFAQPLNVGWTAAGSVSAALRGVHLTRAAATQWIGAMNFRGLTATLASLNQPLRLPAVDVAFAPSQRTITLTAAEAFGTTWRGTVARKIPGGLAGPARGPAPPAGGQWTFDLSADHLDVTDLDRWLGPRARPGLLARFEAFGNVSAATPASGSVEHDAAVERFSARGRLKVGEIALASLRLDDFDGDVELAGRTITVRNAKAGFFGGMAGGEFDAQLLAEPSYHFQGSFDRVDLARLAHAVPFLKDRMSGTASATMDLSAHGVGHENLVASIEGQGQVDARNAEVRGLDFSSLSSAGGLSSPRPVFASAKGNFRVKNGAIDATDFVLDDSLQRFQAQGRIDFSHTMKFQIRPLIAPPAKSLASASPASFFLGGTIEAPQLVSASPAAGPAVPIAVGPGVARR